MSGDDVQAITLLLRRQGPIPRDELARLLGLVGADVEGAALDAALAEAGAATIVGPGGTPLVGLVQAPRPAAGTSPQGQEPPGRPGRDDLPVAQMLARVRPAALVACTVAILLLAAVLLAGLTHGTQRGPALEFDPVPSASGRGG